MNEDAALGTMFECGRIDVDMLLAMLNNVEVFGDGTLYEVCSCDAEVGEEL